MRTRIRRSHVATPVDLIRLLHADGKSYAFIKKAAGVGTKTITEVLNGTFRQRKRGRPTVVTSDMISFIEDGYKADARTTDQEMVGLVSEMLMEEALVSYCRRTWRSLRGG